MKKNIVGLIGFPIKHSISPQIHNEAFKALGLDDYLYVPFSVSKDPHSRIEEAVYGLRALNFLGANVTIPFKEKVLPYLDYLDETAQTIGAVNTIVLEKNGRLCGYNTDAQGFIDSLRENNIEVKANSALILGAGGAARAIVYSLLSNGCLDICILNRTVKKAQDIENTFKKAFPYATINVDGLQASSKEINKYKMIINTTSIGMNNDLNALPYDENVKIYKEQVCIDIIYNPYITKFLQRAKESNAKAINGLGMLVNQAALSFKMWTGYDAPINVMQKKALSLLSS